MSIRGKAAIVGMYEMPSLRFYEGRTTDSLLAETARGAIRDAGLRKEDIDGVITYHDYPSITLCEKLGIQPRYSNSMVAMGASGASSVGTAALVVAAGMANYVLCIFGDSRPPSSSRMPPAAPPPASTNSEFQAPFGPVIAANGPYGMIKARHMYEYGTTQEQFAQFSVNQRFNALENENALWKGQPITVDDVLNSRYVNDPLHLLECVMPVSGAGAVIVTTAERAASLPNAPVYILGVGGPATHHDMELVVEDRITTSPVVKSAPDALNMAGVSIKDIQFAEFYDCYTILAMMCLEDAGVAPKGEIGPFFASVDTTYKGAFPINTDGGQISGGQPGGMMGGFRHVVEGTRQVMGRAGVRQVQKKDLCLVNG